MVMFDFNLSMIQLAMIWSFAGLVCLIPLLTISKKTKFLIVPIVFVAIYLSFVTNLGFIGKPYYAKPEKFVYKYHTVDKVDDQTYITLWAIVKGKDSLYRFPYTKDNEDTLNKAKERGKSGTPQIGEFLKNNTKQKEQKGLNPDSGGDLKMYDFPHQKLYPK